MFHREWNACAERMEYICIFQRESDVCAGKMNNICVSQIFHMFLVTDLYAFNLPSIWGSNLKIGGNEESTERIPYEKDPFFLYTTEVVTSQRLLGTKNTVSNQWRSREP